MHSIQLLKILAEYEAISLIEMDNVKLMNRIDTKFAFNISDLDSLLLRLIPHYKVFEIEDKRLLSYESLYFDDTSFAFFSDHHRGKMNRFKVRVRKYVESNLHFLEVKHKYKGRTNKHRIAVEGFIDLFSENQASFVNSLLDEHKDLQPCLWNNFKRMTFVGKEFNERLTLDIDIQFKWKNESQSFDNLVIAELKQESLNRNSPFYSLMKEQEIRPYRLSKYCIGSIEMHGTESLKYNRFKKKLLKLKLINDDAA